MSGNETFTRNDIIAWLTEAPEPDPEAPVDLHTHSDASDGSFTQEVLLDHAAEAGLAVLALTDHDTLKGLARAVSAGRERGVRVLPVSRSLSVTRPVPR